MLEGAPDVTVGHARGLCDSLYSGVNVGCALSRAAVSRAL